MNRIAVNILKCGKKCGIYAKLKMTFDEVLKNHLRNEGKKWLSPTARIQTFLKIANSLKSTKFVQKLRRVIMGEKEPATKSTNLSKKNDVMKKRGRLVAQKLEQWKPNLYLHPESTKRIYGIWDMKTARSSCLFRWTINQKPLPKTKRTC